MRVLEYFGLARAEGASPLSWWRFILVLAVASAVWIVLVYADVPELIAWAAATIALGVGLVVQSSRNVRKSSRER